MKHLNYQRDMIKFFLLIIISSSIALAEEIKVMVIDTGIAGTNLNLDPYLDKNDMTKHPISYTDTSMSLITGLQGHGTHVAGIIVNNVCKQVKLYSCNYYILDFDTKKVNPHLLECLKRAKDEKMDYVNFSSGGKEEIKEEFEALKELLRDGHTKFITAAGNENTNLTKKCHGYYPACYDLKNVILVGNVDESKDIRPFNRLPSSNYGYREMKWASGTNIVSSIPSNKLGVMSGTSQAAAMYTNELLKERCKEINNER